MGKKDKNEKPINLGSLELKIMDIVWKKDNPCTVSDVHEKLYKINKCAYTTIMTVMTNLYKKDVLERIKEGKAYLYFPKLTREDVAVLFMEKVSSFIYKDKPLDFFACFLKTHNDLKFSEIKALKDKIEQYERDLSENS